MNKRRELAMAGLVGAVASGLAVAAMSTPAPAHAWCVGVSGINIGGGCSSTLGNFALGLGPNAIAVSSGFITGAIAFGDATAASAGILTAAWAGGTGSQASTDGIVSWAMSQGTNVAAFAGAKNNDFANFAFNFGNATAPATSIVDASYGSYNLAANLGGNANANAAGTPTDMLVQAGGQGDFDNVFGAAVNLFGNRNTVDSFGSSAAAINIGNPFGFPNGSDSFVLVGDRGVGGGPSDLSLGFNVQPPFITQPCAGQCGNIVTINDGYLSIAGAVGLVNKVVAQIGPGIRINTPLNPPADPPAATTNVLAARTTDTASTASTNASPQKSVSNQVKSAVQRNLIRPSVNSNNEAKASDTGSSAPKSLKSRVSEVKKKLGVSKVSSKSTTKTQTKTKADKGGSNSK